jgi:putative transcriptional regulator
MSQPAFLDFSAYGRAGEMGKGTLTNNIRRLRFDAGEMTQKELAEKVGVTRQTIVAIEAAKYSPTLELAFQIAHVFWKPLHEVFIWEPDEKR